MPLFKRIVKLKIGRAGSQNGIEITDLRVSFDVDKTNGKEANVAKITIYNAAEKLKQVLPSDTDLSKQLVILEAGYVDDVGAEILFIGNLVNLEFRPQRPDSSVYIEANDGYEALTGKKFGKSYIKGTKAKPVLDDIISALDIATTGAETAGMGDEALDGGYAANGMATGALDDVTKQLKLRWSIQNGQVKIVPYKGVSGTELVSARNLSAMTGLIGAPERVTDKDHGVGYRVKSLLLPSVNPDDMVFINALGVR